MNKLQQFVYCQRLSAEVLSLVAETERALDRFESGPHGILEIGELLGLVRRQRERASEVSRKLPSPNQLQEELQQDVCGVGHALFRFINQSEQKELELLQMANQCTKAVFPA
jgi:hypothetical protein